MIVSLTNEKIKDVLKLKLKKHRLEAMEFVVEGFHLVQEAISEGVCKRIFYTEKTLDFKLETYQVSEEVMKKMTDLENSQGILAVCKISSTENLSDRVLILDGIQDPGNLGTLIRSASAFGYSTIVYENTVDIYNQKVIRASQGAIFKLHFSSQNILTFMKLHPEYYYIGTDLKEGKNLNNFFVSVKKIAIILGNEGSGVNELILAKTNANLYIEMDNMESLNVSVAGSILMHHFRNWKG
ncbi:MAG: RNA methyltransferase [Firmicutes bacterium]|nr:RNA methyltransferase [Bacillota bacterium]